MESITLITIIRISNIIVSKNRTMSFDKLSFKPKTFVMLS